MAFGETLGLLFEINADPSHAQAAMRLLGEETTTKLASLAGVSEKTLKQVGDAGIAAAKDLAVMGGATAGLVTGMMALAEHAAEAGNQIYGASQKTGMSARTLSGVMALAKEGGKSFDELAMTFARASRNLAEAADTGKGALTDLFTQAELQSLKLKPVDEQMHIVLQRIFALNDVGERNRELQALLGRGWMENVGILKRLAVEGYEPAIEMAKKFGVYFDANAAREAHSFMIEIDTLKAEFSGMALTLGRELLPYLTAFLAWLHTAEENVKVMSLRLEGLGTVMWNPIVAIHAFHEATKLENKAIQEQTDWLVDLQKQMKAAADATRDLGDAETHAAGAGAVGGSSPAMRHAKEITTVTVTAQAAHAPLITMQQDYHRLAESEKLAVLPLQQMSVLLPQATQQVTQHTSAVRAAAAAMESETAAQGEALAKGFAGLIAGRKAQAGVEAVWEVARGIACLAEGTWPPNPAAIVASGLHFESAAQYAILAGSGGHHRHAGSTGGGGSDSYSSRGGQGVEHMGGAPGGGAGGGGIGGPGQTILSIQGRLTGSNCQQQLGAWLAVGSSVGLFKFTGAGSSGVGAPLY